MIDAPDLLAVPLHLFTGKGGVGKSTLVAATALYAAQRGGRPLIVELGRRSTMSTIFDKPQTEYDPPTQIAPNVFAMNMKLEPAVVDYIKTYVRVPGLARRIVRNDALNRFFRAAPAVHEIAILHKLKKIVTEGHWSPVLVDLDATGHALMFLELPKVFEHIVPSGVFRRLVDGFSSMLRDPNKTRLHLVTLPLALPVQETVELIDKIRTENLAPLGRLFINQTPKKLTPRLKMDFEHASAQDLALLRLEERRYNDSRKHADILERTGLPTTEILSFEHEISVDELEPLGARMWA